MEHGPVGEVEEVVNSESTTPSSESLFPVEVVMNAETATQSSESLFPVEVGMNAETATQSSESLFPVEVVMNAETATQSSGSLFPVEVVMNAETATQSSESLFPVEVLAPVLKEVSKPLLLRCREVSKNWQAEVDKFYAETAISSNPLYFLNPETKEQEDDYGFFINSAEKAQRFLRDMENHTGNPFPKRLVTILKSNDDDDTTEAFWNSANAVLEKFGLEVWSFAFRWKNGGNIEEKCARLQQCLVLLPNLKRLSIGIIPLGQYNHVQYSDDLTYQLKLFFKNNPLPYLDSLESIQCYPAADIPHLLVESLLDIHSNVKSLLGDYQACTSEYVLPKLEDAALFIPQPDGFLLKTPLLWLPPLKKIYLYKSAHRLFCYQTVFKWLKRFSSTLQEVELSCKWLHVSNKVNDTLVLPNVKTFKLTSLIVDSQPYILSLPSLEHLVLVSTSPWGWGSKEERVIQYLGYETTRNIWGRLPNLQTVVFKGNIKNLGRLQSLNFNRANFLKHHYDMMNETLSLTSQDDDDDEETEFIDGDDLDTQLIDGDDLDTQVIEWEDMMNTPTLGQEVDEPERIDFKENAESAASDPAAP